MLVLVLRNTLQVLGSSGYRAFKYVPYGPVHLVSTHTLLPA
jgi:hypothetical protein